MAKRMAVHKLHVAREADAKRRKQADNSAAAADATSGLGDFAAFPADVLKLILRHLDASSCSQMHKVCKRLRWDLLRQRLHQLGYLGTLLHVARKLLPQPEPPAVEQAPPAVANNLHPFLPQPAPQQAAAADEQQLDPGVAALVDAAVPGATAAPAAVHGNGNNALWYALPNPENERKLDVTAETYHGSRHCSMRCVLTSDSQRQHVKGLLVKSMLQELEGDQQRKWPHNQVSVHLWISLMVPASALEAIQARLLPGVICDFIDQILSPSTTVSVNPSRSTTILCGVQFMTQSLKGKLHPQLQPGGNH